MYRKLILILLLVAMCFPVAMAAYYDNPTYTINSTPPTYTGGVGSTFGRVYLNGATVGAMQICMVSNSTNSQGTKTDGQYEGCHLQFNYVAGPQTMTAPRVAAWQPGKYFVYYNSVAPFQIISSTLQSPTLPVNLTFSISDSTNFATKLDNVTITLSNGVTGTTGITGQVTLEFINSSALTYSLIKTGYTTKSAQPLGGYGETGGILYDTMVPGYTGGNKLVNLLAQDATTGNYINGFTGNVLDTTLTLWTNGTYASGVGEIWTNQSTPLIGYLSATGYTATTSTKTTRADTWAEDWVVPMYKTGDVPVNASWSKLRLTFTYKDSGQPASNVYVTNGYDGSYRQTPGSGVVVFDVPNNTAVSITASKSGYQSLTRTLPVSTALSEWAMEIVLATQPTPTPVPTWPNGNPKYDSDGNLLDQNGNIIGSPTVTATLTGSALTAYNQQQGQNAIQVLYDNGPSLVELCVLVIFMSLIYMLMPKR